MEKKASDFRYNTGETKVPWAAVGENYNAQDLMTIIRFMMKGKGEAYDEALKTVEKDVLALDKVSAPPAKLSLDVEVGKAENMCDEYLHTTGSTFLTNCTAGFEIACKYTGLKPGDFVHTLGDTHLYLNHLDQARLQLTREPRPLPRMVINPEVKSIFDFKYEDFTLEGYDPHPHIKAEVSV